MELHTPVRELARSSNSEVMSPLRRSIIVPPSPVNADDDDEDERERNRRRSHADVVRTITNKSNNSAVEYNTAVQEHFETCLKLFAQNKINVKNVWNLRIIDYLRVALEAKGDFSDRLKLAGISLEVSSKIYSLRVDDLYNDVMKLADALARMRVNKQKQNGDQEYVGDEDDDDADPDEHSKQGDEKQKRRKKAKSVNVVSEEQINGTISRMDAAYKRNLVRGDSSEIPTNLLLPVAYGTYTTLVPCRANMEGLWHVEPRNNENGRKMIKYKIPLPSPQRFKAICPSFADFAPNEIDNHELSQISNTSLCDKVVYDDEGIPIPDIDEMPMNDVPSDTEEMVNGHNDGNTEIVRVVDMRPEPGQITDLEYSFRPVAPVTDERFGIVGAWAGPAHWKIKHLRKPRSSVTTERQSAARDRRTIAPLSIQAERPPSPNVIPIDPKHTKTKKVNIIDRTKLPEDAEIYKIVSEELMLKPGTFIKRSKFSRMRNTAESDANASQTFNTPVVYEYDNQSDVNYCRGIPEEGPGWVDVQNCPNGDLQNDDNDSQGDAFDGGMNGDVLDTVDDMDSELAKAIAEQNVPAPTICLSQQNLGYAARSKKVDMKALKRTMWDKLENECEKPQGVSFANLLEKLPLDLPTRTAKDLSNPIAFVALLHLANEKVLSIRPVEGLKGVTIHKA